MQKQFELLSQIDASTGLTLNLSSCN